MRTKILSLGVVVLLCLLSTMSCKATSQRFIDKNNGTVKDMRTNLIWMKNAQARPFGVDVDLSTASWDEAVAYCDRLKSGDLGLTDGSVAGDWRLPSKEELQGIGTDPPATWESGKPSSITWTEPGEPFTNVQFGCYWSSTPYPDDTYEPWVLWIQNGGVGSVPKQTDINAHNGAEIWPVRDAKSFE